MAVFFKCKRCGELHPAPIAFGDKQVFDAWPLPAEQFQCPNTGRRDSYEKGHMEWREPLRGVLRRALEA